MEKESKIINLYIDKSGALYGAPFGKSKKYGMRPIDRLFLLMPGYTDEMLCEFVNRVFDCCGSEEAKKEIVKYNTCDLLILDDLGTEMPGQFVTASLYGLLNDRILYNKPMVISTNLNVDEIARRYSPQIASRLHGNFVRLTFVGEDIRVLKNRGMQ